MPQKTFVFSFPFVFGCHCLSWWSHFRQPQHNLNTQQLALTCFIQFEKFQSGLFSVLCCGLSETYICKFSVQFRIVRLELCVSIHTFKIITCQGGCFLHQIFKMQTKPWNHVECSDMKNSCFSFYRPKLSYFRASLGNCTIIVTRKNIWHVLALLL